MLNKVIYIPIWLDLLYGSSNSGNLKCGDLHSNMVRFIIQYYFIIAIWHYLFTFQYG